MSKKYVPSGYQIINIDVSDKTSGTPFDVVTEDEKLLYEILSSGEIKKPILLHIKTTGFEMCGSAILDIGSKIISLISGDIGSLVSESITISTTQLVWVETEE